MSETTANLIATVVGLVCAVALITFYHSRDRNDR
jgi:biopolymer transport protein ExbB/TolQ